MCRKNNRNFWQDGINVVSLHQKNDIQMKKQTVTYRLRKAKRDLIPYGVTRIGLFGSTVRNENTNKSDIDILIDFAPDMETYNNYMSVCEILSSAFHRHKLDIVTYKGLSPYIGKTILNEVEYV